jgi:hypothetical protein
MFEQNIEKVTQHLINTTIGTRATISLGQISSSSIPTAVKHFFDVDSDKWVEEEKQRLLQAPHFDYSDNDVIRMFHEFVVGAKERVTFARDEFVEALDQHVKLIFNYVCRPQYTLVKYVFSNSENAVTGHIVNAMQYFVDYEYFHVIVKEYLVSKSIRSMSMEKFENLLLTIDNELVRNFDSWKLAHLTKPVFDLFNVGVEAETELAPLEALTVFFADKNLNEIVDRLDEEKQHRSQISMHDLIMLLGESDYTLTTDIGVLFTRHAGVIPKHTEIPSAERREKQRETDMQNLLDSVMETTAPDNKLYLMEEDGFSDASVQAPEKNSTEEEKLTEGSLFIQDLSQGPTSDESTYETSLIEGMEQVNPMSPELRLTDDQELFRATEPNETIAADGNRELEERTDAILKDDNESQFIITVEDSIPDIRMHDEETEQSVQVVLQAVDTNRLGDETTVDSTTRGDDVSTSMLQDGSDLHNTIPLKSRRKYVKRIFKKSDQAYDNAIEILNRTKTWREASAYLDEIFLKHDIDMYSRIAVKFTDEIYKRYLPKS